MLMGVGVGLTIINTRAVLEALFGVETAFARTPKYAIGDRPVKLEVKKYRGRSGWLPYARSWWARIFLAWWSSRSRLTTSWRFVSATLRLRLYWAGFGSALSGAAGRLRWMKQQRLALNAARQG